MTKIYTLTIELESGPEVDDQWQRVVEVEDSMILYDLHLLIQNTIEFDNDHLFEFFLGRSRNSRKIVFSDDEGFGECEYRSLDVEIKDLFPLNRMKFFYYFDFGDSWTFRIKKARKIKQPESETNYPRVIKEIGENPEQYPSYDEY